MLLWTVKQVTGPCKGGSPEASWICPLIGATDSQVFHLPEVRKMSPFGRWEPVLQVPEECCLYLTEMPEA